MLNLDFELTIAQKIVSGLDKLALVNQGAEREKYMGMWEECYNLLKQARYHRNKMHTLEASAAYARASGDKREANKLEQKMVTARGEVTERLETISERWLEDCLGKTPEEVQTIQQFVLSVMNLSV